MACEGCGLHGPSVNLTRIHVTNGVLTLCDQCKSDVNRKNPALVDLLAACRAVRETCPADPDINPRWNAAWDSMIAAIAKAEKV